MRESWRGDDLEMSDDDDDIDFTYQAQGQLENLSAQDSDSM